MLHYFQLRLIKGFEARLVAAAGVVFREGRGVAGVERLLAQQSFEQRPRARILAQIGQLARRFQLKLPLQVRVGGLRRVEQRGDGLWFAVMAPVVINCGADNAEDFGVFAVDGVDFGRGRRGRAFLVEVGELVAKLEVAHRVDGEGDLALQGELLDCLQGMASRGLAKRVEDVEGTCLGDCLGQLPLQIGFPLLGVEDADAELDSGQGCG